MTLLAIQPQSMQAAALDVSGIGSAISQANAAAAGPTTDLVAAAADEVSTAAARLFSGYAQECEALLLRAVAFHEQFARSLASAAATYQQAETAGAAALSATAGPAVALVMGGTGDPLPPQSYLDAVTTLFIGRTQPTAVPQALFTPEQLYPVTGVRSLLLDTSVRQGVGILEAGIREQLAAGNHVTVFGYSQSAVVASLVMRDLAALGTGAPSPADLDFVLIGNLMNPNGGIFQRFAGLTLPALGLNFYGATPDNVYPTTIYTREYDGFADFPQYPLNFVSVLNAFAGVGTVHFGYAQLTPEQVDASITLPTEGPTMTTYKIIPTPNLPLLDPVRAIPVVGKPLAALVQPDLRVIVNLGYGHPAYGYSTGPANVPTPFGLFPPVSPETVVNALAAGTQQGVQDFLTELPGATSPQPLLLGAAPQPHPLGSIIPPAPPKVPPTPINIANVVASIASTNYGLLLPAADIATSVLVSLPAYDLSLIVGALAQGNVINAIGDPIAANIALLSMAALLGGLTAGEAVLINIQDIESLIP